MRPSSSPSEPGGAPRQEPPTGPLAAEPPGRTPAGHPAAGTDVALVTDASDPFATVFGDPAVDRASGAGAWLSAMLDAERALAETLAAAEVIPAAAARAIGEACRSGRVTTAVFSAASSASPVIPLVRALTEAVPAAAQGWVHFGATSQDIMDTAMMLVSRHCTVLIAEHLEAAAESAAALVAEHRDSLLIGRTLGQHAAPTTFGALAAGWLSGLDAVRGQLRIVHEELAAQLGGPVGTLEAYGDKGLRVLAGFADRLGLADPGLPWHTERSRVARLATTLATVAGSAAKIARDVTLLGSSDVGELREGGQGSGNAAAATGTGAALGGSSAMPHKRNPAGSLLVLANARAVPGHVTTLLTALESELQRPAGAWQSEWQALTQLLRRTGGATASLVRVLAGLEADTDRMRSNLDATGGLLRAGAIAERLAPVLGRAEAHRRLAELATQATASPDPSEHPPPDRIGPSRAADAPHGRSALSRRASRFREALAADPVVSAHLTGTELDELCDPAASLPAARAIADRALARHRA